MYIPIFWEYEEHGIEISPSYAENWSPKDQSGISQGGVIHPIVSPVVTTGNAKEPSRAGLQRQQKFDLPILSKISLRLAGEIRAKQPQLPIVGEL
jgi:hypothetical protein